MTYAIDPTLTVPVEVRRVAAEVVDDAVARLDTPRDDVAAWHEAVHEIRKRMKEFRAVTRLVRTRDEDLHDRWNAAARDVARELSDVRDAHAMLETLDLLATAYGDDVADAVEQVRRDRRTARDAVAADTPPLHTLRDELERIRAAVDDWDLPDDGFDVLAGGLAKTYRRVRRRHAAAVDDPTTEALHELRKRVKYHRLHCDLLTSVWPTVVEAREDAWHDLTDDLGEDHDLAVLRVHLGDTDADRVVAALVDRRRAALQERTLVAVGRACGEDPEAMVDRFRTAWDAAATRGRIDPVAAAPLTLSPVDDVVDG